MELVQKRCRECGDLFTPKNPRQQYCDKLHYRPCPRCGKLIEAKYLSDPPRFCSKECSKQFRMSDKLKQLQQPTTCSKPAKIPQQPAVSTLYTMNAKEDEIARGFMVKKYVGRTMVGYTHDHIYAVYCVSGQPNQLISVYDFTEHKEIEKWFPYSSMTSLLSYFKPVKLG